MKRKIISYCLVLLMCIGMITVMNSTEAASSKPGQTSYYNERWEECKKKVSWKDTKLTPWNGTASQPNNGGDGIVSNPYLVNTAEELRWCLVNQQSCKLIKDIDLGGQNGKNWTGININQAITIDGNGHTVYNLYSEVNTNPGFIASVSNGNSGFLMKNLTLSNAKVYTNIGASYYSHAASFIAQFNAGTVDNCVVKKVLVDGKGVSHGIGGVFSPADSGSSGITIKNTKAINVYVYGGSCVSDFIEGPWDGQCGAVTIENCAAVDGVAISTGGHSGGFTSCVRTNADNIKYKNCYTNVDVYGNTETGVFAGVTHKGTHRFENCYASGADIITEITKEISKAKGLLPNYILDLIWIMVVQIWVVLLVQEIVLFILTIVMLLVK